jgi:hypothetical protein
MGSFKRSAGVPFSKEIVRWQLELKKESSEDLLAEYRGVITNSR